MKTNTVKAQNTFKTEGSLKVVHKGFKPTPKETIVATIGREYDKPTLNPPKFEDATEKQHSKGLFWRMNLSRVI